MRLACLTILSLALFSAAVSAQGLPDRLGWGYGFAGIGGNSAGRSFHAGAGGELLAAGGFGLGAELARFGPTSRSNRAITMFSGNLSYHFGGRNPGRKAVPFATGGISAASSRAAGGNFGFGLQYWLRERLALRVEFRELIFSSDSPFTSSFHFGIAFR